jgi:hypothetical protein
MGDGMQLTGKERLFMERTARRKNLFLAFSILSVTAAALFLLYHGLIVKDLNALRLVIVLLLMLSGRSHLRQYRSALIFNKLLEQGKDSGRRAPG